MSDRFFSDDENLADLLTRMPEEDRTRFQNYGHNRLEAAFVDRVFVIYKPTGLLPNKQHREPEVLNTVRITDFKVDHVEGARITLLEDNLKQEMIVGHVPKKLFGYPIYVSVPARLTLRWDARLVSAQGRVARSLSFAVLVKTKNRSDFYSKGNTYCETPAKFTQLYPSVVGAFKF